MKFKIVVETNESVSPRDYKFAAEALRKIAELIETNKIVALNGKLSDNGEPVATFSGSEFLTLGKFDRENNRG